MKTDYECAEIIDDSESELFSPNNHTAAAVCYQSSRSFL